ncbi:MAG: DEAD/DEAH box helicase [Sedimentisphaerales bacterium]|nr:DEAD/DEAH box helicase [Sedimentisphaerales bacterium]
MEVGLPTSLDEAVLTVYALAFGPLPQSDVVRALKQAGMTMPDGSVLTLQKAGTCVRHLKQKGLLETWSSNSPFCVPEARGDILETARRKGWVQRLGQALKRAIPAELAAHTWEHQWGRRRFVSFAHACRDVFLALEAGDLDELERLGALCEQDEQTRSLVNVLSAVCAQPFQPQYLDRLPPAYRHEMLYTILHHATYTLALGHPVFAYGRAKIDAERPAFDKGLLQMCVNHLAERDVLAGDLVGASKLLEEFGDLDTDLIRGMLALLSGDLQTARQAYGQAVRRAGKAKRDHLHYLGSFPALLHMLLLVQSEQPEDRQLARTWLNWMADGRADSAYLPAYCFLAALLDFHEGRERNQASLPQISLRPERSLATLAACLMQMLYCLYASNTRALKNRKGEACTCAEALLDQCDKQGARWPVMQVSCLMRKLGVELPQYAGRAEASFQQGPARDLSELWAVKEMWESQVRALEELVRGAQEAHAASQQRPVRLGWKLSEPWPEQVRVVPVEQKRTKAGGWTKGREVALRRLVNPDPEGLTYLTDQDKAALSAVSATSRGYYGGVTYEIDTEKALSALAGHPNVFWEDAPRIPVEIVSSTPELHIVPGAGKLRITMGPYPHLDDYYSNNRLIIKESPVRLRVVTFQPLHMKMAEILGPHGAVVPQDHSKQTLDRLRGLSKHIAIQSDVALTGAEAETVEPDCQPHLRLQRFAEGLQAEMIVVPLGQQSQRAFSPGVGNAHLIESVAGRTLQSQRALREERARAAQVLQAVPRLGTEADRDYTWVLDDPWAALELLEQLLEVPPELVTVEWPKGDPITVRPVSVGQFQFSVRSAQNWFEVEGKVQIDQDLMVQMQTLLDQIEKTDGRFIAIGKDQYVALSRQLRKQLQALAISGQSVRKGGALRVHPLAAIGLQQWRDEVGRFEADAAFNACVERFRAVESYQVPIPSTLQASLRPYQQDAFLWLARLAEWGAGACLADDMGLGKTLEALALVVHRGAKGPTLVVAPTSVCANWVSETLRFAPTLRPIRFGLADHGRRDDVLKNLGPFDLLICSYTILQQEADALKDVHFATIVLDEAQAIKNAATKRSSAAMTLTGDFLMICTGTPIENRLAELWNLFRFINPGLLGSEERFQERFVRPIELGRDPHARAALKALVQPFILRRTKSQVLEDLPPRTEMMRLVELSERERALHESLRQRALERLDGIRDLDKGQAHIQVLAELMKLRRCCCNPRLVVPDCGLTGSKLEAFAELVDELLENQHKALVFSQFVDHLTLLREHLDARKIRYQYLDGRTPAKTRQKRIDAFQNGEGDLFLISLKAGGLGLNLTAADFVIHMDPWWNPAVEDQASDRAHRIGQTRPVTVYRLVAAETIEEKIVQLHHAKRDLADSLLEGTDTAHTLTADELIDLLRNR